MVTGQQTRSARVWLGWGQKELADKAAVAQGTVASFESGARLPHPRTLRDIQRALEGAGIEFLFENGKGVGIRVRNAHSDRADNS
jgi:predicted transcriptional regulator